MNSVFKANHPYNNVLLIIYAIVLKAPLLYHGLTPVHTSSDGIVYRLLLSFFSTKSGNNFPGILSFILICIQAVYINYAANKLRLFPRANYLPGMLYLLITSLFPGWFVLSAPLLGILILIWVWEKLTALHNSSRPKSLVFNLGLAIGLASLIYLPFLFFLLLVYAGILISRPFRLPEWVIVFIGLLTPYYFVASILFLSDGFSQVSYPVPRILIPGFPAALFSVITGVFLSVLLLAGIVFIQSNMRRQIVQIRRNWQLIYYFLILAIAALFINTAKDFTYYFVLAFPFSVIIAAVFFYPKKRFIPLLLHWLLFAFAIAVTYFPDFVARL